MNKEDRLQEAIPSEIPADIPPEALQSLQANMQAGNSANISSNADYRQPAEMAMADNAAQDVQGGAIDAGRIKQMAANDIKIIQNLVNSGVVNSEQGQNLMNYVVKKAYDTMKQFSQNSATQTPAVSQAQVGNYPANIENPEFYQLEGRNQVLDYLKRTNAAVGKDEMSQITNMITALEEAAINRHLRKQEHEKTLNNENEAAKQRLRANAQKSSIGNTNGMVFTRDQIGKMSGAEFAKNERLIMEQLRKGLIR